MTFEEGKHRLMVHAGLAAGTAAMPGLLESLRPYQGIQEPLFHDLIESIVAISPTLSSPGLSVDKDVVHSLFYITHLVRAWAIDPAGMLRRNSLISLEDIATMEKWPDVIERVVLRYLKGSPRYLALFAYIELLTQLRPLTPQQQFIMPVLLEALESGEPDYQAPAVVVLGKFGQAATSAIPIVRGLLFESQDQEVREACDAALRSISSGSL